VEAKEVRGNSITGAPFEAIADTMGSFAEVEAAKGDEAMGAVDFVAAGIVYRDVVRC
jgi:hypothetical protein